ncbi:transporter [Bacteroidia bacterium]|nr:transporter [Bacteroidia bacterium]
MNNIKILIVLLFITGVTKAQTIGDILRQIEQNNTVLASLRQYGEAEKIGNKTGIYPANPEVEYHYLWGNKSNIGNRTDFSATQSFDFPTAYHYKQKISENKNIQIDTKYRIECQKILLEAKRICIELIYLNIYSSELDKRLQHARQIAGAYQSKYDNGEANIIDLNKAKFSLLNIEKQSGILQVDRELLKSELIRLNGGNSIDFMLMNYDTEPLPSDFEQWYASIKDNNLFIKYLQKETELSKKNEKLQRALNLPKFFAGYMSEKVMTEHFQGVTVGVSIPLWENKNTVKQIKARTLANQATENDANFRFYNETKALYRKAVKLRQIITDYTKNMIVVNNSELLKKALDTGELSLIDYMQELSIYYESVNNLFETEKKYHLIVAEMKQWIR